MSIIRYGFAGSTPAPFERRTRVSASARAEALPLHHGEIEHLRVYGYGAHAHDDVRPLVLRAAHFQLEGGKRRDERRAVADAPGIDDAGLEPHRVHLPDLAVEKDEPHHAVAYLKPCGGRPDPEKRENFLKK